MIDSRDLFLSESTCKSCRPICERARRWAKEKGVKRAKIVYTGCKNGRVYVKVRCSPSLLIWVYKLSELPVPLRGGRAKGTASETGGKGAAREINKAENETIKNNKEQRVICLWRLIRITLSHS